MQGIYTYIPETNHVPKEYNVTAILSLLIMVPIYYYYYYYYYYVPHRTAKRKARLRNVGCGNWGWGGSTSGTNRSFISSLMLQVRVGKIDANYKGKHISVGVTGTRLCPADDCRTWCSVATTP
jgi:hypothetical protein